jgi:cell shape-determining protein MreD
MRNWLDTFLILAGAFLAVFGAAAFQGVRHLVGVQIDLLPALMVYASLRAGLTVVASLAVLGGLWFDSLSAQPFGISVLPLAVVGLVLYANRSLVLRDQTYAQFVLGAAASLLSPVLTLLLLLTLGRRPLVGWGTLWQLLVLALGGAAATPIIFLVLGWLHRALGYRPVVESTFRSDRQIRRGRS